MRSCSTLATRPNESKSSQMTPRTKRSCSTLQSVEHLIDERFTIKEPVDFPVEGYEDGQFKLSMKDIVSSDIEQVVIQVLLLAETVGLPDREFRLRLDEVIQGSDAYDGEYLYVYADTQYSEEMKVEECHSRWWVGDGKSRV